MVVKEGKRLASIIKQEAKVEKKALEAAVRELAELQKLQKYAVKVRTHPLHPYPVTDWSAGGRHSPFVPGHLLCVILRAGCCMPTIILSL